MNPNLQLNNVASKLPSYKKEKPFDLKSFVNSQLAGKTVQQTPAPKTNTVSSVIKVPAGQQYMSNLSANNSATATKTPAITPAKITSPAGQQYMSGLAQTQNTQLEDIKKQALGIQSQIGALKTTETKPNPQSAYVEYLKTMFNPEQAKMREQSYQQSQQRLADIQSQREKADTEARRRYEELLDASGGLKSGAEQSAAMDRRRSNQELADIALQESAAARTAGVMSNNYENYLNAGKSLYDIEKEETKPLSIEEATTLGVPYGTTVAEARALGVIPKKEEEGFSLSEGEARYDAQGKLIAARAKTYAPGTGSGGYGGGYGSGGSLNLSPEAQGIIQQINLGANLDDLIKGTSIPAQKLRNEVIAGLNAQGGMTTKATELLSEGLGVVNNMLNNKAYNALGGYSAKFGGQWTTSYGDAKAQAAQLQAILARDNLGLLKGAMSDKDLAFIQSMSSGFEGEGTQSEGFIKQRLEEIQTKLKNKIDTSGASNFSSGGGQPQQMNLNGQILYLQADGTYQ